MILLYLVIGIILWPIITYPVIALVNKVLMPLFDSFVLKRTQKKQLAWANVFQATSLIISQVAVVLITKEVLSHFHKQTTSWFAVPFGLWCLVCGIMWPADQRVDTSSGLYVSANERHIAWSWAVGLGIGWIIGTILLFQ